jgi:hypothetical protein
VFDLHLGSRGPHSNFNTADSIYEIKNSGIITVIFDYISQKAPFFGQCYINSELIEQIHHKELQ